MKPTEQQLQDIYQEAVSAECAENQGEEMATFDLLCKLDEVGGLAHFIRTMIDAMRAPRVFIDGSIAEGDMDKLLSELKNSSPGEIVPVPRPTLTVWYGAMPETNGKTNWTAILHRKGECLSTGITIDRSEYPDRVRYGADRMRHLIGELAGEPDILAYDADAHSGYVAHQQQSSTAVPECSDEPMRIIARGFTIRENGEANSYTILKDEDWFANILMNGEMTVPQHLEFLKTIIKKQ